MRAKKLLRACEKGKFSNWILSAANELFGEARNLILTAMIFFNSVETRYIIEGENFLLPKEIHSLMPTADITWNDELNRLRQ